jgi:hypothetical protein
MSANSTQETWQKYVETEIETLRPLLSTAGYTLDENQPHTKGERFLMKNITTTSGEKLILVGTNVDGKKVVIKAAKDFTGKKELEAERTCRIVLQEIDFSYKTFDAPTELAFFTEQGYTISIQEYIEQTSAFLERPIEQQFTFALNALKTQESARITTNNHLRKVGPVFGIRRSGDYIKLLRAFLTALKIQEADVSITTTVQSVLNQVEEKRERIEQYCGFLTHTDFVPHNFRIAGDTMYLLDWSSLEFGNKHESWARFLNFMTLYNPELETLLIEYVEKNRAPEERESLQLLRLYRLCELITYYSNTLAQSDGDLLTLNQTRVQFWHKVLKAEMQNKRVDPSIVETYKSNRDNLRSTAEKERQENLH